MRTNPRHYCCLIIGMFAFFLCFNQAFAEEKKTRPDNDPHDVKKLMALPYLAGYFPAPEKTNVTRFNRDLAAHGYNLYSSGHAATAILIDMKGNVLHQWAYPIEKVFSVHPDDGTTPFWEDIYLYDNGDLLAIYHDGGIIKLDKDSNLLWSYRDKTHHAIDVDAQGSIYTLTEEKVRLKEDVYILDNSILILTPEGQLKKKVSLFKLMHNSRDPTVQSVFKRVLAIALAGGEDVYHTNNLEILSGKQSAVAPKLFKKGNILTCMLTISSLAVIDLEKEEMVWILGPELWYQGQHDPDLLDNGRILVFDNHYWGSKEQSRVFEFDPLSKKVSWEYRAEGFYTDTHGTNETLANGNILIVESNTGRAFEITREKETVWEFLNPHTTGKYNDLIAAIFVLYRTDPAVAASWLQRKSDI